MKRAEYFIIVIHEHLKTIYPISDHVCVDRHQNPHFKKLIVLM